MESEHRAELTPEPTPGATAEPTPAPAEAAVHGMTRIVDWIFRIRDVVPLPTRVVLGVIPILALLLIWFGLTTGEAEERIISPVILPSPLEVLRSVPGIWFEAELSRSVLASTMRVAGGFGVAILITLPLGILMGSFTRMRALFEPLMVFGAYLPIPALVPLTLSFFGAGEAQKIVFLAIAFTVYLLPLVVKSLSDVSDVYLRTAQTLGASRWQVVRHVLLGVSWPEIYNAMRLGFGIGWSYIIIAEMVDIGRGIGSIIIISQRRGPREHIYLALLVIVLVAWVVDRLWVVAGRKIFPHRSAA